MSITSTELFATATQACGLSDWGDPAFRESLDRYLDSVQTSGRLNALGREVLKTRTLGSLINRLRLIEDRKRDPEIGRQTIDRPIIVLGLPRSGSSNLLDLLAQDPANRAPRTWEMLMPSPPPRRERYETDPRIDEVQRILEAQHFDDPDAQSAHPFGARQPEECGLIFETCLQSGNYPAFFRCPEYTAWYETADFSSAYRFHRQFLQHLQAHCAGERWILKAPEHTYHPEAMVAEYPDAIFIQTHRDPYRVLPSITSLVVALRKLFSDEVDPLEVARWKVELNAKGLERTWAVRQDPKVRERFYDVHFADLIARPLETVERFYAHFGLPLSNEARMGMRRYVEQEAKARHGHGRHVYSAQGFGFGRDEIDRIFGRYIETYQVKREAVA